MNLKIGPKFIDNDDKELRIYNSKIKILEKTS